MKSKFIIIGSVGALLSVAPAMADKSAEGPAVCGPAEECAEPSPGEEVLIQPIIEDGQVVEPEPGEEVLIQPIIEDGEVVEPEPGEEVLIDPIIEDGGTVEITLVEEGAAPEVIECGTMPADGDGGCQPAPDQEPSVGEEGPDVPVDWVKRGEAELENPDVIFMTTADGGPEGPVVTDSKADIDLGQDDKAAVIEGKGMTAAEVRHEKKGPVALVKKGRVFLR